MEEDTEVKTGYGTELSVAVRPKSNLLVLAIWVTVGVCLVGIIVARLVVTDLDHALANIFTALLSLLSWLLALLALFLTEGARRVALTLLGAPLVVGAAFLSLFQFQRLDSELIPHFVSRWGRQIDLPQERGAGPDQLSLFAPSAHDFPQFLGPNRNAIIELELDPNWESNAPEVLWNQPIGEGWSGFVTQGDVAVTMEQRDEDEWVSAYAITSGELLWHYAIPARHTTVPGGAGPRSTPLIHNGLVYACSAVNQFVCLDFVTGDLVWSRGLLDMVNATQEQFESGVSWGRSGSPLISGDAVLIPLGGVGKDIHTLIAFDAASGDERWQTGSGQITYSSPVELTLAGQTQILLVAQDQVSGYAPDDGRQLWTYPWPGKANGDPGVAQPVFVSDTQVMLGKGYGGGAKLLEVTQGANGWQASELWSSGSVMKTKFTTAVVRNGFAYGLSDGILECIDVSTGKRQWKRGRYRHGQLLLVGEHLLILSEEGELALVATDPEDYRELATFPVLENVSWNTLALSGNRLLVRNSDSAACVLLPVETAAAPQDDGPPTTE